MSNHPAGARDILVKAVVLGATADIALRNAGDGFGWTLWILALALAAFHTARRMHRRLGAEQLVWLAFAVACATGFAARDADQLRVANVLGTLVSVSLFAMTASGLPVPSVFAARLRDLIAAGVYAFRDVLGGAFMLVSRDADLATVPALKGGTSWSLLRAIIITIPVVAVFGLLLSGADPVFASWFRLSGVDITRMVPHLLLATVFAWLSAGWLRGALLGTATRATMPDTIPLRLGLAEVTASLGAVILLFAIFIGLQLRWLFGGADVVLATTGLTVAEYARRGFFELVAVALLVLPLILGTRAAITDGPVVARHRRLSLVLIGLLAAIVVSALLRMRLYVTHFGLTSDRFYATALMFWIAIVAVVLARSVASGDARRFVAAALLPAFALLLTLNVLNPDGIAARMNVRRSNVDYEYLAGLSGDAAPDVVEALSTAPATTEACAAARRLRTHWTAREGTEWNLGAWRARAAATSRLGAIESRLCVNAGDSRS